MVWQLKVFCPVPKGPCVTKATRLFVRVPGPSRDGAGYQENCRRQSAPLSGCFAWGVALYRRGCKCRQNIGSLGCVWCNVDGLRRWSFPSQS